MARKTLTELNANYASRKTQTLHATCDEHLKKALQDEAHRAGMTDGMALRAATIAWVNLRRRSRK